jgi:hypothetical protein
MPAGTKAVGAAWLGGGRIALVRSGPAGSELLAAGRRLLAVPGRLSDPVVAPDGRHVLVAAPDAGQWLIVRTQGGRLTAYDSLARQFAPGADQPRALPRPLAWFR